MKQYFCDKGHCTVVNNGILTADVWGEEPESRKAGEENLTWLKSGWCPVCDGWEYDENCEFEILGA
jgi:hypothetical protein